MFHNKFAVECIQGLNHYHTAHIKNIIINLSLELLISVTTIQR